MSFTDPLDPGRSLSALGRLLERVEVLLDLPEDELMTPNPGVSKWNVVEHLFHIILACDLSLRNATSLVLDKGRLVREPQERSDQGLAILGRGLLPRGVAQAPRFVIPPARIDLAVVRQLFGEIEAVRTTLTADLDALRSAPRTVPHQLLGDLTCGEWLRFARAHTAHHLLIVRDLRASG